MHSRGLAPVGAGVIGEKIPECPVVQAGMGPAAEGIQEYLTVLFSSWRFPQSHSVGQWRGVDVSQDPPLDWRTGSPDAVQQAVGHRENGNAEGSLGKLGDELLKREILCTLQETQVLSNHGDTSRGVGARTARCLEGVCGRTCVAVSAYPCRTVSQRTPVVSWRVEQGLTPVLTLCLRGRR